MGLQLPFLEVGPHFFLPVVLVVVGGGGGWCIGGDEWGGDDGIRRLVYNSALGQDSNVEFLCSPLSSYLLVVLGIFGYSNWFYEEQFMTLLTVIEERQCCLEESTSLSKLGNKGNRELRGLESSINYDPKGESSSLIRARIRGLSNFLFYFFL